MLTPDDERLDRESAVAVISDGFWRRTLGGAEAALGQTFVVNDVAVTVIGIALTGILRHVERRRSGTRGCR